MISFDVAPVDKNNSSPDNIYSHLLSHSSLYANNASLSRGMSLLVRIFNTLPFLIKPDDDDDHDNDE